MGAYMYIEGLSVVIPARNEPISLDYVLRMIKVFSKYVTEVIVIVDSESDSTLEVRQQLINYGIPVSFVTNQLGGISNALKLGVNSSKCEYLLVAMADELVPVISFDEFYLKLNSGADIVSATRYSKGGIRYGGNKYGRLLSYTANKLMSMIFRDTFTDFTTGMKAFKKSQAPFLLSNIDYGGWAPALKISINAIRNDLVIEEVPIISVDRLLDGKSSFKLGMWATQYLKALVTK
jgi:dolichol-phosphate mannosyltransferase